MQKWEVTFPRRMLIPEHPTKSGSMKALGITPALLKGLRIGNWHAVTMRFIEAGAPINYINKPPLNEGDRVEVLPGNSVMWATVGQKGVLDCYFEEDDKWGIDIEGGIPTMVMAGNLKRIPK
jgi:hypothetical protein